MSQLGGLVHLLKANSKKLVDEIFSQVFKSRTTKTVPDILIASLKAALQITDDQSLELVHSIRFIVKIALYENTSNLASIFPADFHKDLKQLVLQLVDARLPQWREDSIKNQCSLPHLVDIDWRIDVKRASDSISNMSVPSVLVQLKVKEDEPEPKNVIFELNKQTLETMLDGLTKIKTQLSSLNK